MRQWAWIVAIVASVAVCDHFAFQAARAGTPWFFVLAAAPALAFAGPALFHAQRDGVLGEWMRPRWGDFSAGFFGAVALFVASYGFVRVALPPGSSREAWMARLYLQLGDAAPLRKHAALVAVGLLLVAAAEEIVFRGFVVTLLAEKVGSRRAWVYAIPIYALGHVGSVFALADAKAGTSPLLIVAALGGGLVWGGMARRFDRLPPGIIAHALFDWCVLMMFRLWGASV